MEDIRFSIIVPTYNEENDIGATLEALERLEWKNCEVIVVDDASRDATAAVVERFVARSPRFTLLRQKTNGGVSSARNVGIRRSNGGVLVILNADVLLPPDFLGRIAGFYREGNQWVSVQSLVANQETAYGRFNQAEHWYIYRVTGEPFVWTEGFSCTREAAESIGLFPDVMPGAGGEDADFGRDLERRYPGVRAMDIVVPHVVPDKLRDYWQQQVGRGKARTYFYLHMRRYGFARLFLSSLLASSWRIAKLILLVPVRRAWQHARYSEKGRQDFAPFVRVAYIKELATLLGLWRALFRISAERLRRT